MRGVVSFHPVELSFFDDVLQPLLLGKKVNPEDWLERALRLREAAWATAQYKETLETLLEALEPPPPPESGTLWEKVRARLERLEYRPQKASVLVAQAVERELHLEGRPFFITEGSADSVALIADEYCKARDARAAESLALEQLLRLDKTLGGEIDVEAGRAPSNLAARRELLNELQGVHDLARAAEAGETWSGRDRTRRPAEQVLAEELPWQAVRLASRAVPFWIGRDVDGLETICKAAGLEPPECIVPAYRLFGEVCERFPGLQAALHTELCEGHDVGAFVPANDVTELLDFLNREGSTIIRSARRAGEAEACTILLRKIRECARYAESHGMAYLEAAGVPPLYRRDD